METKIWKLHNDITGKFFYKSFEEVSKMTSWRHFDFIYKEIYHFNDSPTSCIYEMWDCLLQPDDTVLDLGANCGFFTHLASTRAKKVIAVDGSSEAFSCLVENCSDRTNIQYLNASVLSKEDVQSHLWSKNHNPLRLTLEELMKLYNLDKIDFIKCDIEGGEYKLLQNLSRETLDKIDRIACETHDDFLDNTFHLPGKIRHTFKWNYGGGTQTHCYFVTPK